MWCGLQGSDPEAVSDANPVTSEDGQSATAVTEHRWFVRLQTMKSLAHITGMTFTVFLRLKVGDQTLVSKHMDPKVAQTPIREDFTFVLDSSEPADDATLTVEMCAASDEEVLASSSVPLESSVTCRNKWITLMEHGDDLSVVPQRQTSVADVQLAMALNPSDYQKTLIQQNSGSRRSLFSFKGQASDETDRTMTTLPPRSRSNSRTRRSRSKSRELTTAEASKILKLTKRVEELEAALETEQQLRTLSETQYEERLAVQHQAKVQREAAAAVEHEARLATQYEARFAAGQAAAPVQPAEDTPNPLERELASLKLELTSMKTKVIEGEAKYKALQAELEQERQSKCLSVSQQTALGLNAQANNGLKYELDKLRKLHEQTKRQAERTKHDLTTLNGHLATQVAELTQEVQSTNEAKSRMVPLQQLRAMQVLFFRSAVAVAVFLLLVLTCVGFFAHFKSSHPLVAQCEAAVGSTYADAIDAMKEEHSERVLDLFMEREQLRHALDSCTASSSCSTGQDRDIIESLQREMRRLQQDLESDTLDRIDMTAELYELRAEHQEKIVMLDMAQEELEVITTSQLTTTQTRLVAGENLHPYELLLGCSPAERSCQPHFLQVGQDGNVAIFAGSQPSEAVGGEPVWSTNTARRAKPDHQGTLVHPHHELRLRRDGVLVVVDTDRAKVLWRSSSFGFRKALVGEYVATIDHQGRLVVSLGGEEHWASAPRAVTR